MYLQKILTNLVKIRYERPPRNATEQVYILVKFCDAKSVLYFIIIIIIIYVKDWTSVIRSVSRFTTALANVSSVFQLFSFLVVCSDMISTGSGFVAFFASVLYL